MGNSPFGFGTTDSATVSVTGVLPDLRTGISQSSRFIDPTTKSYVFQADGRLQGVQTVRSLVDLALRTVRLSACQADLGQTFTQIQEKGQGFVEKVRAAVGTALASLVQRNLVELLRVDVTEYPSAPDAGVGIIIWRDKTTGVLNTSSIGP